MSYECMNYTEAIRLEENMFTKIFMSFIEKSFMLA